MTSQEYIVKYLENKDRKWLEAYLYYYESHINEEVRSFVHEYSMPGHFMDLKSAYVFGILNALQHYDPEKGSSFQSYQKHYVKRAIDDYIRTSRTGYSVPNDSEYLILRKIMAMYAENDYQYSEDLIRRIAAETKRTPKTVQKMLESGLRNMRFSEFYLTYTDDDGKLSAEDVTTDYSTEPYTMYLKCMRSDALRKAYDHLEYRERDILAAHLGFCSNCWSTWYVDANDGQTVCRRFRPEAFIDIAARYGMAASTAERIYRGALKKLRKAVEDNSPGGEGSWE